MQSNKLSSTCWIGKVGGRGSGIDCESQTMNYQAVTVTKSCGLFLHWPEYNCKLHSIVCFKQKIATRYLLNKSFHSLSISLSLCHANFLPVDIFRVKRQFWWHKFHIQKDCWNIFRNHIYRKKRKNLYFPLSCCSARSSIQNRLFFPPNLKTAAGEKPTQFVQFTNSWVCAHQKHFWMFYPHA